MIPAMELSHRTPEDLTRLRDRMADLELELATLEQEVAIFQADYMRQVGTVMAQVHDLEARMAAIVAERSGNPVDAQAADEAGEQARRSTAGLDALPDAPHAAPSADLKTLFRTAAKAFHPDRFAGDPAAHDHAEAFMKRLNAAYREGDADAINDLMRQWESSPIGVVPDDPNRMFRELAALRIAVAKAEERLAEARSSPFAVLMERALAATMAGEDLLGEMQRNAKAHLEATRERYRALAGD